MDGRHPLRWVQNPAYRSTRPSHPCHQDHLPSRGDQPPDVRRSLGTSGAHANERAIRCRRRRYDAPRARGADSGRRHQRNLVRHFNTADRAAGTAAPPFSGSGIGCVVVALGPDIWSTGRPSGLWNQRRMPSPCRAGRYRGGHSRYPGSDGGDGAISRPDRAFRPVRVTQVMPEKMRGRALQGVVGVDREAHELLMR
jgi:hypothetical protein